MQICIEIMEIITSLEEKRGEKKHDFTKYEQTVGEFLYSSFYF